MLQRIDRPACWGGVGKVDLSTSHQMPPDVLRALQRVSDASGNVAILSITHFVGKSKNSETMRDVEAA